MATSERGMAVAAFHKAAFSSRKATLLLGKKPTTTDEILADCSVSAPMTAVVAPSTTQNWDEEHHPWVKFDVCWQL